jgi:hypothetical protein
MIVAAESKQAHRLTTRRLSLITIFAARIEIFSTCSPMWNLKFDAVNAAVREALGHSI